MDDHLPTGWAESGDGVGLITADLQHGHSPSGQYARQLADQSPNKR